MKQFILSKIKKDIKKQYPSYSNEKLDEIMYGVEGLYMTITKCIIIFTVSIVLGILKEVLILLIFFNILRAVGFGMHASNGVVCLISSMVVFLGIAYISNKLVIKTPIVIITYLICIILYFLFAPSDTKKRPLIKKKKRTIYKVLSITILLIYLIISLVIKNNLVINCMLFGALIELFLINPISYKVFKAPYNNYKNYGLDA